MVVVILVAVALSPLIRLFVIVCMHHLLVLFASEAVSMLFDLILFRIVNDDHVPIAEGFVLVTDLVFSLDSLEVALRDCRIFSGAGRR